MSIKTAGKVREHDEDVTPIEEIGVGDQVRHPLWGLGIVMARSGSGEAGKAVVVFQEEGQKKLMLRFAKLKKIGSAPKSETAKIKAIIKETPPPEAEEPEEFLPEEAELGPIPPEEEPPFFPDEDEEEQFADRKKGADYEG